jgi:predicted peptidase
LVRRRRFSAEDLSMTLPRATAALFGAALLCLLSSQVRALEPATGLLDRSFTDADGKPAKYMLFVPDGYDSSKVYPLVLFLHGAGETGTDGKKQTYVGLGPVARMQEKNFPFFIVFPQSQDRSWQADSKDGQRALAILDEVRKNYKIDDKRLYLTGLSMGGFGTWSLAQKYPDRWAAIVPVCGGGDADQAKAIKDVPCWVFQGDADTAVTPDHSRKMVEALKAAGGNPKYTEYAGIGHNSWEMAYNTPGLYEWLLMQHK